MEWLDENPELVSATLSMVEMWERSQHATAAHKTNHHSNETSVCNSGSSSAEEALESDHVSATQPTKATKPSRNVNNSRERRKQELAELRGMVATLQSHLASLRRRRQDLLRPHYNDGQLVSVAPVWEAIATRQFQTRKKAEDYNTRLRQMIKNQQRVAEELIAAIRHAQSQREPDYPRCHPLYTNIPRAVNERMALQDQSPRLNVMASRWREAFALSSGFAHAKLQFNDASFDTTGREEPLLYLFSSVVMPFTPTRVSNAMWDLFLTDSPDDDEEAYVSEASRPAADQLTAVLTSTVSTDGTKGTVHGKLMSKRIQLAPGDFLQVTHMYMEHEGFGNALDDTMLVEESWVRLVDAREIGHSHLTDPLATIQHVRCTRMVFRDGMVPDSPTLEKLGKFVCEQVDQELTWARDLLENHLLKV